MRSNRNRPWANFHPITKEISELEALWRMTEDNLTKETTIEANASGSHDSKDNHGTDSQISSDGSYCLDDSWAAFHRVHTASCRLIRETPDKVFYG